MAMHVTIPRGQAFTTNGAPDPGATLAVYNSETTTYAAIFSDDDLSVPLENPMSANARGVFPRAYIAPGTYKVVLTYSDATAETYDLVETGVSNISSAVPSVLQWQAGDSQALARSKLGSASTDELASISSTVSSLNATVTGFPEFGDLAAEDTVTSPYMSTGMVVGSAYGEYTSNTNITGNIPADDTIPQISEGTQIIAVAYTPKAATNKIRIRFRGETSGLTGQYTTVALFKDSNANAVRASTAHHAQSGEIHAVAFEYEAVAGTTSATTWSVRAGANAGDIRFNGTTGGRFFGGTSAATLIIEEIKV